MCSLFWSKLFIKKRLYTNNKRIRLTTRARNHKLPVLLVTFNVELANGDLEVVDKLVEVQKDVRGNPPAERPRVGALKTPVSRRQMPRVGWAYEDAGCGHAEDARQQVAQVAVGAERARGCGAALCGRSARRRGGSAWRRVGSRRRAVGSPPVRATLFLSQSRTRGRVPSARGVRAKLLERKLAARPRESEAEFETLACGSGSHLFRKT